MTKEEIREGLLGFLGNVFSIENTSKGYAVAMPALMADGWQVTFWWNKWLRTRFCYPMLAVPSHGWK